jgi:phosphoribosyl-ATP pyrophosphohydrolase/phosphoribosyl-AMP cyclohydrolase
MNGKAVQLVGGKEKALERENPVQLARQFDRFGEIAVIDLDAALGNGDNREIIKQICRFAHCRVGGGIRTTEQAKELVSLGARKIIIGSKAFENNTVNIPFLRELNHAVGKERIIAAVDARNREIVVNGWRTPTGLDLIDTAKKLEPYVSQLLFTCVEKEGKIQGTDMETIRELRTVFSKPLTAAGGVRSLEEIEALAKIDVDVQLGMALYTGMIKLDRAFISSLNWKEPLIPVITVDRDGQVLMQAYTDRQALEKTFETGNMWYYSRSRRRLWMKGETSGNVQKVIRLRTDCDKDTILATVEQTGPACHLETYSCFGDKEFGLSELYDVIARRFAHPVPGSYTAALDHQKVREKLLEEAREVMEAATPEEVIWEAADLLYFLTVLLQKEGITIDDVLFELRRRRLK